jgi:H+/Cl- antiporter ClcA
MARPRPPSRALGRGIEGAAALMMRPVRSLLNVVTGEEPPLDLRLVGRTVLEAIVVGLTVGAAGCLMLVALEFFETQILEHLLAYPHLRAVGEAPAPAAAPETPRLYLVLLVPALGGLLAGLLARLAPEIRGGGGDAMIEAFHHRGGVIRRRVAILKPLASIATLASGGAGGREGPTMHLGGAIGSWIGSLLPTTDRERRVLMIAGVAAGVSAVFRTPLGAALLAIEVLYRDDFESEALVPAVLASVVAYSLSHVRPLDRADVRRSPGVSIPLGASAVLRGHRDRSRSGGGRLRQAPGLGAARDQPPTGADLDAPRPGVGSGWAPSPSPSTCSRRRG